MSVSEMVQELVMHCLHRLVGWLVGCKSLGNVLSILLQSSKEVDFFENTATGGKNIGNQLPGLLHS